MRMYQYFQDSWSDILMYFIHITMRQIKKEKIKRVPIVTADFLLKKCVKSQEESLQCLVIATKYTQQLSSLYSKIFPDFFINKPI